MHVEKSFVRNLGGLIRARQNCRADSERCKPNDEYVRREEGDSSEEAVEGRALPKGNISQTTVVRTQSRAATSSGLAGVRKAARQA